MSFFLPLPAPHPFSCFVLRALPRSAFCHCFLNCVSWGLARCLELPIRDLKISGFVASLPETLASSSSGGVLPDTLRQLTLGYVDGYDRAALLRALRVAASRLESLNLRGGYKPMGADLGGGTEALETVDLPLTSLDCYFPAPWIAASSTLRDLSIFMTELPAPTVGDGGSVASAQQSTWLRSLVAVESMRLSCPARWVD